MNSLNLIHEQFDHMLWADAKVWEVIHNTEDLQNDVRLKKLLYHLHVVQHAFFNIWTGKPMEFPKESDFENLKKLYDWVSGYNEKIKSFLTEINAGNLSNEINIPWSASVEKRFGKKPKHTTLAETMMQVITHSHHHRGQINTRIRELEGEPPLVDYIVWVWRGKPGFID